MEKIGTILRNGGTAKEIQKIFPHCPQNPSEDFFLSLGYKESTARTYISLLKKNQQNKEFVISNSANLSNILVDTSAFGYQQTVNVIEKATQVTFILSTLEEMDKLGTQAHKQFLSTNIHTYTKMALKENQKYLMSSFSGMNNEKYPDNILLQYLLILPKQLRPTLLTVDQNLALKAKTFHLDYILFIPNAVVDTFPEKISKKKVDNTCPQKILKKKYGIKIIYYSDSTFLEYQGTFKLEIIYTDGSSKIYESGKVPEKIPVNKGDLFCLHVKENSKIQCYQDII